MADVFALIVSMDRKAPQALYKALRNIYTALENGAMVNFERALRTLFARYDSATVMSPTGYAYADPLEDQHDQPYVPGKLFFHLSGVLIPDRTNLGFVVSGKRSSISRYYVRASDIHYSNANHFALCRTSYAESNSSSLLSRSRCACQFP